MACNSVVGVNLEVRDGQQRTAMHLAAIHGQTAVVQQLAAAGADPSSLDQDGKTPLHLAAEACHEEAAAALLAVGGVVDSAAAARCKLLHAVVRGRMSGILSLLIGAGAAVEASDMQYGQTLLHVAVVLGCTEAASALIGAGLSVDVQNSSGATALHKAACHSISAAGDVRGSTLGSFATSEAVGMDMEVIDGTTPMLEELHGSRADMTQALLAAGANLEARDAWGRTPMHLAAAHGNIQVVQQLASAGASAYALDAVRDTPLHLAVQNKHTEAAVALQAIGACPDPLNLTRWPPLPPSAAVFYAEVLQRAIAVAAAADSASRGKHMALALASSAGFSSMVEELLSKAAAMDLVQHAGLSALQLVAVLGNTEVFGVLIQAGKATPGVTGNFNCICYSKHAPYALFWQCKQKAGSSNIGRPVGSPQFPLKLNKASLTQYALEDLSW